MVWPSALDVFGAPQAVSRTRLPRCEQKEPLAPPRKGLTSTGAPKNAAAVSVSLNTPIVPIERVQQIAAMQRADHPTLDDNTVSLCILKISTRKSDRAICKELGCSHSWMSTRLRRPEVQTFLQELAVQSLGVAASRAIKTVADLTYSKNENMRLTAARELLDRAGLGNSSSAPQQHGQGFAFTFASPVKGAP